MYCFWFAANSQKSHDLYFLQHFQKEMKQLSLTLAESLIERAFTIKLSSKKMKKSVVIVTTFYQHTTLLYRLEKEFVHRREKQGQEKSEMNVRYYFHLKWFLLAHLENTR